MEFKIDESALNETERYRLDRFRISNPGARKYFITATQTGIANHFVASARFWLRTIKEDITDYDSW